MSMNLNKGLTVGAGLDYFVDAGFSISEWGLIECGGVSFETII
jgi:F0F1-type ATP synthase assembly protein I